MSLSRSSQVMLGLLAFVAAVWFLQASRAVTLPLTFALFLVVLFWPLQRRLRSALSNGVATAITFLLALGVLVLFGWSMTYTAQQAVSGLDAYQAEIEALRAQVEAAIPGDADRLEDALSGLPRAAAAATWSVAGYLVVVLALFVLALTEVPAWHRKLRDRTDDPVTTEVAETARRVVSKVQRFLAVQAVTSVLTGILTWLVCVLLGVDLALLWGMAALVLNFIPTLGSIVAIVPPTLFAALQFGLGWRPAAVLAALAVLQLVLGSYVDPKLQGKYLELSAFVVLVAIVFWGWVWGIAGAFVAVPLTAAIVLACGETEGTRWVADLLTRDEGAAPEADRG